MGCCRGSCFVNLRTLAIVPRLVQENERPKPKKEIDKTIRDKRKAALRKLGK